MYKNRHKFIVILLVCFLQNTGFAETNTRDRGHLHVVESGDTLCKIALRYCGHKNKWQEILTHNPNIQTSGHIKPGDVIKIPNCQVARPSRHQVFTQQVSRPSTAQDSRYAPKVEFSYKVGNKRNIGQLSLLFPIWQTDDKLWFLNSIGMFDSHHAKEGNFGMGFRSIYNDAVHGAYFFYDRRKTVAKNMVQQWTFGLEYLTEFQEIRTNVYVPTTNKQLISNELSGTVEFDGTHTTIKVFDNEIIEAPMYGFDVEWGSAIPHFEPLQFFLAYYHFNNKYVKSMNGFRLRSQLRLSDWFYLEGEYSYDGIRKNNYFVGGRLLFSLYDHKKPKLSHNKLQEKMTQMPIRDIDVVSANGKGSSTTRLNERIPGYYPIADVTGTFLSSTGMIFTDLLTMQKDHLLSGAAVYDQEHATLIGTPTRDDLTVPKEVIALPTDGSYQELFNISSSSVKPDSLLDCFYRCDTKPPLSDAHQHKADEHKQQMLPNYVVPVVAVASPNLSPTAVDVSPVLPPPLDFSNSGSDPHSAPTLPASPTLSGGSNGALHPSPIIVPSPSASNSASVSPLPFPTNPSLTSPHGGTSNMVVDLSSLTLPGASQSMPFVLSTDGDTNHLPPKLPGIQDYIPPPVPNTNFNA